MCGPLSAASQGLLSDVKMRLTALEAAVANLEHQLQLEGLVPVEVENESHPAKVEPKVSLDAFRSEADRVLASAKVVRLGRKL